MRGVVLLGTAPSSMMLAPYGNKDWDVWACSPGTMSAPRVDRRYELHRWEPGKEWFSEGYVSMLKAFPGPVVMGQRIPEIPNSVALNWKAHVERFGRYFFTSTLAWMMADAICEGFDKIALYGVDMAATTEYHDQRMGCQYMAMIAQHLGIEVGVPPESDLFRPAPLYGICEHTHLWIKETARARELAGRKQQAMQQLEQARHEIAFLDGALDDQDWHLHSGLGADDSMHMDGTTITVPLIFSDVFPMKAET